MFAAFDEGTGGSDQIRFFVRTTKKFEGDDEEGELSFKKGTVIGVIDEDEEDGTFFGKIVDDEEEKEGWFPQKLSKKLSAKDAHKYEELQKDQQKPERNDDQIPLNSFPEKPQRPPPWEKATSYYASKKREGQSSETIETPSEERSDTPEEKIQKEHNWIKKHEATAGSNCSRVRERTMSEPGGKSPLHVLVDASAWLTLRSSTSSAHPDASKFADHRSHDPEEEIQHRDRSKSVQPDSHQPPDDSRWNSAPTLPTRNLIKSAQDPPPKHQKKKKEKRRSSSFSDPVKQPQTKQTSMHRADSEHLTKIAQKKSKARKEVKKKAKQKSRH